jgi:protein TonB
MDRHLVLGLLTAAAIHGGLFFGIPRGAAPVKPVKEAETIIDLIPHKPAPEDPVEAPPDDPQPKGDPDAYKPIIDDVVVVATIKDFTQPVAPAPPVNLQKLKEIKPGVLGVRDGSETIKRPSILPVGLLDKSPRTIAQPPPQFPYSRKIAGIAGEVQVEFTVDERGHVIEPRVVHSTDREFDEPTLQAVRKWRFEPGTRNGQVVRFRMVVPVVFNLNE